MGRVYFGIRPWAWVVPWGSRRSVCQNYQERKKDASLAWSPVPAVTESRYTEMGLKRSGRFNLDRAVLHST